MTLPNENPKGILLFIIILPNKGLFLIFDLGNCERKMKVPKDPFLGRQNQQQQSWSNEPPPQQRPNEPNQQNSYNPQRQSPIREDMKMPNDPYIERQRQDLQSPSSPPSNNYDGMQRPKDPFMESQRNQQQQSNFGPQSNYTPSPQRGGSSTAQSNNNNSTSDGRGIGNESFGSRPSFGGRVSFGSRTGDDMTYEEYSSYFDETR